MRTWPSPASWAMAGISPFASKRSSRGTVTSTIRLLCPFTIRSPRKRETATDAASEFVADLSQEVPPGRDVLGALHPLGREAIHDPHHPPTLRRSRHDDLDRVRRGTVDGADLLALLHGVQDVDGIRVLQDQDEEVAGGDHLRVLDRDEAEALVVARGPDQAGTRGLAEGDAELRPRHGGDQDLVEVFDRLDEVA